MSKSNIKFKINGLGCIGAIIAAILSWIANKSILWAIVHFCCNWLYIVYWIFAKTKLYDFLCEICTKGT